MTCANLRNVVMTTLTPIQILTWMEWIEPIIIVCWCIFEEMREMSHNRTRQRFSKELKGWNLFQLEGWGGGVEPSESTVRSRGSWCKVGTLSYRVSLGARRSQKSAGRVDTTVLCLILEGCWRFRTPSDDQRNRPHSLFEDVYVKDVYFWKRKTVYSIHCVHDAMEVIGCRSAGVGRKSPRPHCPWTKILPFLLIRGPHIGCGDIIYLHELRMAIMANGRDMRHDSYSSENSQDLLLTSCSFL